MLTTVVNSSDNLSLARQISESFWLRYGIVGSANCSSSIYLYFPALKVDISKSSTENTLNPSQLMLPIEISVWMPIVIIFIFSAVGMLHANQK